VAVEPPEPVAVEPPEPVEPVDDERRDDQQLIEEETPFEPPMSMAPIQSSAPIEPVQPSAPIQSSAPIEPVQPSAPIQSSAPIEPVQPSAPIQSSAPVQPTHLATNQQIETTRVQNLDAAQDAVARQVETTRVQNLDAAQDAVARQVETTRVQNLDAAQDAEQVQPKPGPEPEPAEPTTYEPAEPPAYEPAEAPAYEPAEALEYEAVGADASIDIASDGSWSPQWEESSGRFPEPSPFEVFEDGSEVSADISSAARGEDFSGGERALDDNSDEVEELAAIADAARETFRPEYEDLITRLSADGDGIIQPDPHLPTVEMRPNGDVSGSYGELRKYLKSLALTGRRGAISSMEAHHLLENGLMSWFGIAQEDGLAIALESGLGGASGVEHSFFSAQLPNYLHPGVPRGGVYDIDQVLQAHQQMYRESGYPEWADRIEDFVRENRGVIRAQYENDLIPGADTAVKDRVFRYLDAL
jgi:hypothetical protein